MTLDIIHTQWMELSTPGSTATAVGRCESVPLCVCVCEAAGESGREGGSKSECTNLKCEQRGRI